MRKYDFIEKDKKDIDGHILTRIVSNVDIVEPITHRTIVSKGDIGGYIEKEENLSHEGNCWIAGEEMYIYGESKIEGDVIFRKSAYGKVENTKMKGVVNIGDSVSSRRNNIVIVDSYITAVNGAIYISGKEFYMKNSILEGDGCFSGDVTAIKDHSTIKAERIKFYSSVFIGPHLSLYEPDICVERETKVFEIENPRDYIVVRGIGSAGRKTFVFREKNSNKAFIVCGCFNGSLQEFIKEVNKEYPAKNAKDPVSTYRKEYLSLINMIRAKEKMWMKERREKDTEIEEYFNAIKETSIPLF